MKKKAIDLVLQIIPVMIGVYLGFVISNWGEDRKKEKQSQALIDNIKSEISLNREKLKAVIDYHIILKDSSKYYLTSRSKLDITTAPRFFKGIQTEVLLESAYNTGIQTGIIANLDLDLAQNLNQIYAYQHSYNDYTQMTLEGLINMNFENNEKSIRKILQFIAISMADIVVKEYQLLENYESILGNKTTKK